MKDIVRLFWLSGVMVLLLAGASFGETMYAKKNKVKVTAEKSPTSKVVTTLNLGDAVSVVKKSGRQYQVKLRNGKSGWVFKFKLSDKKPSGSGKGSSLSGLSGRSTMMAKESRAGGSIRGLKETTEQYAQNKKISPAHQRAVDKMEQLIISAEELDRFQRDGGVGEYAGGGQ